MIFARQSPYGTPKLDGPLPQKCHNAPVSPARIIDNFSYYETPPPKKKKRQVELRPAGRTFNIRGGSNLTACPLNPETATSSSARFSIGLGFGAGEGRGWGLEKNC